MEIFHDTTHAYDDIPNLRFFERSALISVKGDGINLFYLEFDEIN
jgi:hypothetical protein